MSIPLDFEVEDQFFACAPATKRTKVIGLDDLLADYYTQQNKVLDSACVSSHVSKVDHSEDEDDRNQVGNEVKFIELANECEKQMSQIIAEQNIPLWGQKIFGQQKSPPLFNHSELKDCKLLEPLSQCTLGANFVYSDKGSGWAYLEELLVNGWLSQLSFQAGFVEAAVASWTFYKAMYSSVEDLQLAACDFWCRILSSKTESGQPSVVLEWAPGYHELKEALVAFGYLSNSSVNGTLHSSSSYREASSEGPPLNIQSWIKILSTCFQFRNFQTFFSASEAEEFLLVVIRLFLERQLQGLLHCLTGCMQSIMSSFTVEEWDVCCENVAQAIADSVPRDLNCLRIIECISGSSTHHRRLMSRTAIHMLGIIFAIKVTDVKGILKSLVSIQVKDKECKFLLLYICLVLFHSWLLTTDDSVEKRAVVLFTWNKFLRDCSCNISSTDWRPYASKVRSKASYLLQTFIL
ncbi:hypothetical protein HPP92_020176 [Vanilla planifolia]|uniref:Coiled-coil SMC6 And NSE5 INteracting (CANIN) domain-containing protein n=1 Tax=Vanilla planifolia TaxID=51239 RepID=A0A835UJL8_VANPL|nr:hypothetical protein HPP92_020176 [Vanilla planifolia]